MLMSRVVDWPEGSRLTGVVGAPKGLGPGLYGVALLDLIDLPDGQQGSGELSTAHAHLPFAGSSIHGAYPDGSEWILLTQVALVDDSRGFETPEEAADVLEQHFRRYLRINPKAIVVSQVLLNRLEFLTGYQQSGVNFLELTDWGVDELLAGMVCEMCNVPLPDVVAGRTSGCTFPDLDHICTGDGLTDVFAQWSQGLLSQSEDIARSADSAEIDALRRGLAKALADAPTVHSCRAGEHSLVKLGELQRIAIEKYSPPEPDSYTTYQNDVLHACEECGSCWLDRYWEVVTPERQFEEFGHRYGGWIRLSNEQVAAIYEAIITRQLLPHEMFLED